MSPKQKPHRSEQSVGTPWAFIRAVEDIFGKLDIDLAASKENAKAPVFLTEADDSLSVDWHQYSGRLWLNPPYTCVKDWARKAAQSAAPARHIFLLVPASVGSNWYWEWVAPFAEVYAVCPRLTFEGHTSAYPKDLILAHYSGSAGAGSLCRLAWRP